MGKAQRAKGRRGEAEAKHMLADRDYTILADTSAGISSDDLVALSPEGRVVSVEVKNQKSINVPTFLKQCMDNAKKNDWLLMCKIDGTSSWLVLAKNKRATVWHNKGD